MVERTHNSLDMDDSVRRRNESEGFNPGVMGSIGSINRGYSFLNNSCQLGCCTGESVRGEKDIHDHDMVEDVPIDYAPVKKENEKESEKQSEKEKPQSRQSAIRLETSKVMVGFEVEQITGDRKGEEVLQISDQESARQ